MSASDKTSSQDIGQHQREQQELDRELEGTFPASDPPAITRPRGHSQKSATDARARADTSNSSNADDSLRTPAEPSPFAPRPRRQRPVKR
jgi:hypothetical protein